MIRVFLSARGSERRGGFPAIRDPSAACDGEQPEAFGRTVRKGAHLRDTMAPAPDGSNRHDAKSRVVVTPHPLPVPAGLYAETRHLRYDDELGCWTVRCLGCGEDLPCASDFYTRDTKAGGVPLRLCKACRAERFRKWYRRRHAA